MNVDKIETISKDHVGLHRNDGYAVSMTGSDQTALKCSIENRRLLPNSANGVHIIDGVHNR